MAISWRRGFFRVWVVLTTLWLIIAGGIGIAIFSNTTINGTYAFIESKGDTAYEYFSSEYRLADEAKSRGLMQEVHVKDISSISVFVQPNSDTHDIGQVMEHFAPLVHGFYQWKHKEAQFWVAVDTAFWAIVVPLIVLALGTAVAWALSGFTSSPRRV